MQKRMIVSLVAVGVYAALASPACAIAPTGFMPALETFIARLLDFITGVFIPTLSWVVFIGLIVNFFTHTVRIGGKIACFVIGLCLLGGGMPWLSTVTGGAIATSFTLP